MLRGLLEPMEKHHKVVISDKAVVAAVDDHNGRVRVGDGETADLARRVDVAGDHAHYASAQQHWIAALQGKAALLPTAEIALNTMLISEAIYLSSQRGEEVSAEEEELVRRLLVIGGERNVYPEGKKVEDAMDALPAMRAIDDKFSSQEGDHLSRTSSIMACCLFTSRKITPSSAAVTATSRRVTCPMVTPEIV